MPNPDQARVLARHDRWRETYAARLATYHPDVRAEVEMTVRERFLAGNFTALSNDDQRHCLMRVASRMRVKGENTPAGEDGSGAQLKAIVAALQPTATEIAA